MDSFNIDYSTKNIPLPGKDKYKLQLISKTESLLKRMRWKCLQFLGKLEGDSIFSYGFKSRKSPALVEELSNFEYDMMMTMVKNLEFRNYRNNFQIKLKNDIDNIRNSSKLFIHADKSRNIYKLDTNEYDKLLRENISKTYKKSDDNKVDTINYETKMIVSKLNLLDRVDKLQEKEAHFTIKDHKESFPNKIPCRLINPSKTELDKISKQLLDNINRKVVENTRVNQWENTKSVLEWFQSIERRNECSFIVFDIDSFYPSISEKLFNDAINYTQTICKISEDELNIILQSRKTLLFYKNEPWVKKLGNEDFDVPMGCFDGAEICELVGSFILSTLSSVIDKNDIGLYRDDGLGVLRNLSGPEKERTKKKIIKLFKDHDLTITAEININIVNYLDVQLNITDGTFRPYRKPNNDPVYINKDSNHLPNIIEQNPKAIEKRISEISSNEIIFNEAKCLYENALKTVGSMTNYLIVTHNNMKAETLRKKGNAKETSFGITLHFR